MLSPENISRHVRKLQTIQFKYSLLPLFLVGLYLLIFGLSIPSLGFYWDDWPSVFVLKMFGAKEFLNFFAGERPLEGLSHIIFGPFLQGSHIAWQIFTLSLRVLSVLSMGWAFRLLWPLHRRVITVAVVIFAVYPAFLQQPISVTYHVLWLQFVLFFTSIACMILSVRRPRNYLLFTCLSLAAQLMNLILSEYFYMVELIRPVLLWFLLAESEVNLKKRTIKVLRYWSPYLIIFVLYLATWLYYRSSNAFTVRQFGEVIGTQSTPSAVIDQFTKSPLSALYRIGKVIITDSLFIIGTSWFRTLDSQDIVWSQITNYIVWGIGVLTAGWTYFYLSRLNPEEGEDRVPAVSSVGPVVLVGGLALLFGALPAWLTNHQMNLSNGLFADRFAAVSQFGASLLIATISARLLENWRKLALITSILIGLASGYQFRTVLAYRSSWHEQIKFYWQFYWRAPSLKPNTLIVTSGVQQLFNVRSSTSFALNDLYLQPQQQKSIAYWVYPLRPDDPPDKNPFNRQKGRFSWGYRNLLFLAERPNGIMVYYNPPQSKCYWFLKPEDALVPNLPENVKQALAFSSIDRIDLHPIEGTAPSAETFGAEPKKTWCYYYQKAELARQSHDWQQITTLGDQAWSAGWNINNHALTSAYEWMPFIEGYARAGNWRRATDITVSAYEKEPTFGPMLCRLWKNLGEIDSQGQTTANAAGSTRDALSCP